VHGGHLTERAFADRYPRDEVVVVLADQAARPVRPLHVGLLVHLAWRHRDVGPAGLLGQLAAGGRVIALASLDAAARGGPVLPLRRRVVIPEQQHPAGRVDRDHPAGHSHRQLSLVHRAIVPVPRDAPDR
jgi:hypothetical protein